MSKFWTTYFIVTMLQICQNIMQERKAKGLSQTDIALKMGLERNTYKNWEIGTEPDLSTIKTIAAALEIPAWRLLRGVIDFTEKNDPKPETITIQLTGEQVSAIRMSLGVLDSAFGLGAATGKDNRESASVVSLSGKRKPHQGEQKKDKQKGI